MLRPLSASLFCVFLLLAGLGDVAHAGDGDHDELQQRITLQEAKLAELKAVVAENPKLKGLEGLIREVESNLRTLQAKAGAEAELQAAHARLAKHQAALARRRAEVEKRRADLARRQAEMTTRTGLSTVDLQRELREKAERAALRVRARQTAPVEAEAVAMERNRRLEARFDALRQQLANALAAKDRRRVKALKAQLAEIEAFREATAKRRAAPPPRRRRVAAPKDGVVAKVRHLREAARHLRAAGHAELAERILGEAAKLEAEARHNAESKELLQLLRSLRQQVGKLREDVRDLKVRLDDRR